ncbi:SGNH/GDSL hydrolase family protein [Cytobacillus sp. S13-E01]|uniref:SGNH/GDSL hydrolase family protein n=1 Tax=Cytobacillus sp. S13-E01 TaxID=3031326 RepID=UPI0023D8AA6C|nr:SGNH/GDSL hydrolase family protein [Cytobacillus sp. S13-E01]MDF0725716.1 SGNH/GDSL hydrolase family protein [Cytobacillus sp. S13-E01]
MIKTILILLCISLLVSCSSFQTAGVSTVQSNDVSLSIKQSVPESFFPKHYNIVAFGDSLTEGIGDTTNRGGYVPLLEEMLLEYKGVKSVKMTNLGIKGNRTSHLIKRLETNDVRSSISTANIVIITVGGNDVMKVVRDNFLSLSFEAFESEQRSYENRLRVIINQIRAINENTQIVLVGVYNPFFTLLGDLPEIDQVITNWNEGSNTVLQQYERTTFVEVSDIFMDSEVNLLYTDEFHPNLLGYQLMAERINQYLETILSK